ncbi:MAG: hypothetical protein AABZ13_00570, partial [Planctomycetota bacterium]
NKSGNISIRFQSPAWERDCDKSSALSQKKIFRKTRASGTIAFPCWSLGTRSTMVTVHRRGRGGRRALEGNGKIIAYFL